MKYDDLDLFALIVVLFLGVICLVAWLVHHEKQHRPRPNIRVPRETLWGRTQRYHEASRGR